METIVKLKKSLFFQFRLSLLIKLLIFFIWRRVRNSNRTSCFIAYAYNTYNFVQHLTQIMKILVRRTKTYRTMIVLKSSLLISIILFAILNIHLIICTYLIIFVHTMYLILLWTIAPNFMAWQLLKFRPTLDNWTLQK